MSIVGVNQKNRIYGLYVNSWGKPEKEELK